MTATDTSPVSVASYFVNMYFSECLPGYCPEGYRIPNQMELAIMNYYMDLGSNNLYSRTYWSFGPYSGNYGSTGKRNKANDIGFIRLKNKNLTVDASNTTQYARCVKDIRMN